MRLTLLLAIVVTFTSDLYAQDARVQVVHNCADALAAEVDIYVNGVLTIDNAPFRVASPFTNVPTGLPAIISIAPGDSNSVLDAFYTEQFTLEAGETYLMIAEGIESASGYNPAPPFSVEVYTAAREAAQDPSKVDVLVHHGSTDAPTVDIVETAVGLGTVVDDISYTQYAGYLEVDPADYVLEVRDAAGSNVLKSYEAPLATLNLQGAAITVVASGFLDPSQNSNGPEFGLFAVSPLGGPLLPLPEVGLGTSSQTQPQISIYPNPATDFITIEILDHNEALKVVVYDVKGVAVIDRTLEAGQPLDVSALASGTYAMRVQLADKNGFTTRFVKN